MNECRNIEPLLYLFREGELSADEKLRVSQHVTTCSRCKEILDQLHSMVKLIAPLRESEPQRSIETKILSDTMQQLSKRGGRTVTRRDIQALVDALSGFLRPALGFGLIAAALLFVAQQSRDALKVADLERRLQTHGTMIAAETMQQTDLALLEGIGKTLMSAKPNSAAIISDPSALLGTGFMDLFRRNTTLFDEISRRYPRLSSITVDDGIDEQERNILATDGRAFIQEFEQLIGKGEK